MSKNFWEAIVHDRQQTEQIYTKLGNKSVPFCADKTPEFITDGTWRELRRVNVDRGNQVFPIMS